METSPRLLHPPQPVSPPITLVSPVSGSYSSSAPVNKENFRAGVSLHCDNCRDLQGTGWSWGWVACVLSRRHYPSQMPVSLHTALACLCGVVGTRVHMHQSHCRGPRPSCRFVFVLAGASSPWKPQSKRVSCPPLCRASGLLPASRNYRRVLRTLQNP